ncbi:MAG: cell wall-binding repeat-containing protein [Acidimicrobiales bacterium]
MVNARRVAYVALMASTVVVAVPTATARAATVGLQLVWSRSLPGVTFRESSPVPATLSSPAFVVGAQDAKVYAFDAATGADEPGWPVVTTNPINSSPAAADVVGDGRSRIFIGSGTAASTLAQACSGGGTYAIEPTGAVRWHHIGSDTVCANQAFHSSFAIGDINGDSQADATIGALGETAPSYTAATGTMNSGWPFFTNDTVFSSPALANIGVPAVIMGGDSTPGPNGAFRGGMMRAINGAGQLLWQFNVDEQVRSSPAIGDVNGQGLSVLFGTGNFWLQNGGASDSTSLFSLDAAGHLRWRRDLGGVTLGGPALADVTGGGAPDVIEGTAGTPSNPNEGRIWVLDGNGNPLPGWNPHISEGGVVIGSISTADLNGDGAQDLLVPTGAGVLLYDGKTAQQIGAIDLGLASFQNTPLVTAEGGAVGITVAGTQPDGTGVVQHYRVAGGQLGAIGWPMFHHDPQHTGNLATLSASCAAQANPTAPQGRVKRLDGPDRDTTGVAVSQAAFPTAGSAGAVVVASNDGYADALAGGPLAVAHNGPLLITPPRAGLDPNVNAEIRRVLLPTRTVYVLGGPVAVDPSVVTALQTEGYSVTRVAGPDRFATAVAIADALHDPATVFEVTGFNFADALAAGPPAAGSGGVVLLTNGSAQAAATGAYVSAHPGTHYAIGGPAAAADPSARPISGADRYATALAVASRFFSSPAAIGFASGAGFADALTGGPSIAHGPGPLLLVPPCGALPAGLGAYVSGVRTSVKSASLFGGPKAVGDDILAKLDAALA